MRSIAWAVATALLALPAAAQTPDVARQAAAADVVAHVFSNLTFTHASVRVVEVSLPNLEAAVVMDEAKAQPDADAAKPLPEPKFDAKQLHASLELGIGQLTPLYQATAAQAYARHFTLEQLRAMQAFLATADGKASIVRRTAFAERGGGDNGGVYVETSAEKAFDATPAGAALKAQQSAIGHEVVLVLDHTLWPRAISVIQTDYCQYAHCGAPERAVFVEIAKIWDQAAEAPASH